MMAQPIPPQRDRVADALERIADYFDWSRQMAEAESAQRAQQEQKWMDEERARDVINEAMPSEPDPSAEMVRLATAMFKKMGADE
jgi:hypothetical protein